MTNNEYHKAWRERNKEHFNAYQRAYKSRKRAENPELKAKQNAAALAYYHRKKSQFETLLVKVAELEKED